MVRTYTGIITKLRDNEVFVFGANESGFHGAGSAGYASFGVIGNYWRKFDYHTKPDGWQGKWNCKGSIGPQVGTEGRSYGLVTVTKAGAKCSKSWDELNIEIEKFYTYAKDFFQYTFYVAQTTKTGLNGLNPARFSKCFLDVGPIPNSVIFENSFGKLINSQL